MKHSEISRAFEDAFGRLHGPALQRDLALTQFGSRTAHEAVEAGEDPQKVWLAVCDAMDLSEDWWYPHRRESATRRA
ncbi:MAG: DUF3046 domain-containing protein [bacterium]|nr:DUF3046 domain-containing protein [bacterium]